MHPALPGAYDRIPERNSLVELDRNTLLRLAIFTLVGFGAAGLILDTFWGGNRIHLLVWGRQNLAYQLLIGGIYGWVSAWLGWRLIKTKWLRPQRIFFTRLIRPLQLSSIDIVLISLCAGIGEEMLFRGALQYFFGVWPVAIIFVAIHGYLNPFSWRLSLYGLFMTVVIAGLGYMTESYGLVTAMAGHTLIDIYLLRVLSK